MARISGCDFVPPYLLARIAANRPDRADRWRAYLARDAQLRARRDIPVAERPVAVPDADRAWVVHTADNTATLPGRVVRSAGDPEAGDAAVDEAAAGITGSLALLREVHGRDSYDGAGATVSATVHYERDYANAFWDGTQLVFGDGDGEVFARFTRAIDVVGHEFAHALTEHTAGLTYAGQSGALNESMSDVFAACLTQRLRGQTAADADWLIGSEIFLPGVDARALRDMADPGTAYDDPVLGQDPQPGHMDDYVETSDDNGGVHINSGIPNRAFHLAATAIGGSSAEGAGRIWYAALTGDRVGARTGFEEFATATVAVAGEHAAAVARAWETVGIDASLAGAPQQPPAPSVPAEGGRRIVVRRSGGLLGRAVEGALDLDSDDEHCARAARLLERIDLDGLASGPPHPDRFVYDFDLCGVRRAGVPEQVLTDDLAELVRLVLR